jgi:hypothetical protein
MMSIATAAVVISEWIHPSATTEINKEKKNHLLRQRQRSQTDVAPPDSHARPGAWEREREQSISNQRRREGREEGENPVPRPVGGRKAASRACCGIRWRRRRARSPLLRRRTGGCVASPRSGGSRKEKGGVGFVRFGVGVSAHDEMGHKAHVEKTLGQAHNELPTPPRVVERVFLPPWHSRWRNSTLVTTKPNLSRVTYYSSSSLSWREQWTCRTEHPILRSS